MCNPFLIFSRVKFWLTADRVGPDMPITHWMFYFRWTMRKLCEKKFSYFGDGAEFRPGAAAEACSNIKIGKNVVIRPGSFLCADPRSGAGKIIIEDDVLIGASVHFYTNNHLFGDVNKTISAQGYSNPTHRDSIVLRRGCWIGACSILLPGVEVGENAVVAAGSVVTKSVSPFQVVAGNPAKVIKNYG